MTAKRSTAPDSGASSDAGTADAVPERIAGRYAVKRLLGRGGFGAVFEAYDELEERSVALKLIRGDQAELAGLPLVDSSRAESRSLRRPNVTRSFGTPGTGGSSGVAQAFKDEFRLLTQLHHPNLATVFDFGRCNEQDGFFFTQELVRGVELSAFLKNASREVIAEVFVQLARALDYIHALGLMHGDIKPSNVLVSASTDPTVPPQAKLIDFGLARMLRDPLPPEDLDDEEEESDEDTITVLGTPGFSAPEKVRGQPTDARADIYSLAATMYAAIRGSRPFPGKTFREVLKVQRDWRPELAGALLQSAGPVVAELIGRMLQPDPHNRPQSARSILLELLRREASHLRNRQQSEQDRREFARVLVSHLPFVDRAHYLELLMEKASAVVGPDREAQPAPSDPAASSSAERMRVGRLLRTVVVKAPEGMGKSRLMSELRREVQLADGLFVEGNCWSSGRNTLGPFASVITQLATALGDDSVAVRSFPELIHLARRDRGHESAAASVTEFLISAAQERPYVLLLTALAKAPEQVRQQFDQLSRAIDHSGAPVLLCATTEPHSKVLPIVQGLSRDQCSEVWNLRPFTVREMQSVLQGVLGDTPVIRDLADMLDKLTGGHPLSFRETLRVLIEEGILVRDTDSWSLRGASAAADELQFHILS